MTPAAVPAGIRDGFGGRAAGFAPSRDEAVDALAVLVLTLIGIAGFRLAYGGDGYLSAGAAGAVAGRGAQPCRAACPAPAARRRSGRASWPSCSSAVVVSQSGAVSVPDAAGRRQRGRPRLAATADHCAPGRLPPPACWCCRTCSACSAAWPGTRSPAALAPCCCPPSRPRLSSRFSILFGASAAGRRRLAGRRLHRRSPSAWAAARQQRGAQRLTAVGRQRPWQRIGAAVAVLAVAAAGATVIGPAAAGRERAPARRAQCRYRRSMSTSTRARSPGSATIPRSCRRASASTARSCSPPAGWPLAAGCGSRRWTPTTVWPGASPTPPPATRRSPASSGWALCCRAPPAAPARTATITIVAAYTQPWLPDLAGTTGFSFAGPSGGDVAARCASTSPPRPASSPAGCPPACATRSAPVTWRRPRPPSWPALVPTARPARRSRSRRRSRFSRTRIPRP